MAIHGRSEIDMDCSWEEVATGQGFTYTPCIEIFDDRNQETEVM
jgi:hypothetical protein